MQIIQRRYLSFIALPLLILFGCSTVPSEIDPDLSKAELIQLAQEAVDAENDDAAIAYYNAIVERFSEDLSALATARYEIAFLHYKRNEMEVARSGFQELLAMYEMSSETIPEWPRVLAQKLLREIDEQE